MELKINTYQTPAPITFNYEELKEAVQKKADEYASVVYTEETLKSAKTDRAELNKLKDALNGERIRLQKEYMKPFEDYKSKTDELIRILSKPIDLIGAQIKDFEQKQKAEKKTEIELHFKTLDKPEWLKLAQIWNEKWLNKTYDMGKIRTELKDRIEQIENDLATLSNLPEFGFEACKVYESTLDVNKALNEGKRLAEIQKQKEEAERKRKEEEAKRLEEEQKEEVLQPPEPGFMPLPETYREKAKPVYPVRFEAMLTAEQGKELAEWFNNKNIKFRAI